MKITWTRRFFDAFILGFTFFSVLALDSSRALALDCLACSSKKLELTKNATVLKQHEELLAKNKDYLSKINVDAHASQAIKVKSNILVIVLRIDTFKNNIEVLKKELDVPACKTCEGG